MKFKLFSRSVRRITLLEWGFLLGLFLVSLMVLRTFKSEGVPFTHDVNNHLARIANLYLAYRSHHFPFRWAPNLNYKFGYPVFNFNYYFPYALCLPLIIFGFSIETAWKIVVCSSFFSGGVLLFKFLKRFFPPWPSFTGAVFYLLAPYQLVDIFVRGMTGEIVAFGLLPGVLLALDLYLEKRTRGRFVLSAVVLAMFLLTHNIIVLISLPLILGFLVFRSLSLKKGKRTFVQGIPVFLIAVGLSLFFWLPALMEKKYTNLDAIDMSHFYQDHFPTLKQLVLPFWGYGFSVVGEEDGMSFSLGPVHFGLVIASTLFFALSLKKIKRKETTSHLYILFFLCFWASFYFMLQSSKFFWERIPFLNYVQFPWRLLFLTTISSAFMIAFLSSKLKNFVLNLLLIGLILLLNLPMCKPQSLFHYDDYFYYEFPFTSSTKDENMPIWFEKGKSDQLMQKFTSESGLVTFRELEWKTDQHLYEINVPSETFVYERTVYFPGWRVFLNNQEQKINYRQKDYPGIISYNAPAGKHVVKTLFSEKTPARIIGDSASVFSLLILGIITMSTVKKRQKQKK